MSKFLLFICFILFSTEYITAQQIWNVWYQYGPYGGKVTDITVSDFNETAVIAAGNGSVYVYDWVDLQKNENVSALEYFPNIRWLYAVYNDSLKKTGDNGYHWYDVFAPGVPIKGLSISRLPSGKIFIWSDSLIFAGNDGNSNWFQLNLGFTKIHEVFPSPLTDTIFYVVSDAGLFRYTFSGDSENLLNAPVNSIACSHGIAAKIYVSSSLSNTIYFSSDMGVSWDSSSVGLPAGDLNDVAVYNSNPQIAFAATTDGIYKTVNGGEVWFNFSNGIGYNNNGNFETLGAEVVHVKNENIWAGTTEGIFNTTITNDNWIQIGTYNQSVNCIAKKSFYFGDNLFIGTPKGVQKTDGYEWTRSSMYSQAGPDIYKVYSNRESYDSLVIAVEMKENGSSLFYRSTDNGNTFSPVFLTPEGTGRINAFYTREDSSNIIFALADNDSNSYGVFYTKANSDSGSWQPLLSTHDKKFNTCEINTYFNKAFFIINDVGLYESRDGGWTFEYIADIPIKKVNDLLLAESNYFFAAGNGIRLSSDMGLTWVDWGLDSIEIFKIVYDWWSLIAASHTEGVFANYHLRGEWIPFNIGMPTKKITDMENYTHGYLHASTESNSVFMMYLIINEVKDDLLTVNSFRMEQNYPNPFNPTTKIKFSIPAANQVTLKVYDVLGRETAVLINKEMLAGSYEVEFDGGRLSSGVYFYRLEAGSYSSVKKMIIIK